MTAYTVISCDGHWHGMPCRGTLPTRRPNATEARYYEGIRAGWTRNADGGDLCPAHTLLDRAARRGDQ